MIPLAIGQQDLDDGFNNEWVTTTKREHNQDNEMGVYS